MIKPVKTIKVMLVDDSFLIRGILKNILKLDKQISVLAEASNGEEALSLLDTLPNLDIILLDIEMPVMSGLEFLRAARLQTSAAFIIVSSLSGNDSAEIREALALGACEMINKPSGILSVDMEATKSKVILDCIHRYAKN